MKDDLPVLERNADNMYGGRYAGLTTISQLLEESGRLVMEILLAQIGLPSRPLKHVKPPLALSNAKPHEAAH
jgi:DNA-binding LacI/PurR family transcriptional regulator